jgi:chromosome segregation ATPase
VCRTCESEQNANKWRSNPCPDPFHGEPIQDDIETNPIPQTTLMIPRRDFDRLVAQVESLREAVTKVSASCDECDAERDRLIQAVADLGMERDQLTVEVESLREESGHLSAQLDAATDDGCRVEAERDSLIKESRWLKEQMDKDVEEMRSLEAERDRLKAEVKAWEQAELATIRDLTAERDRLIQALKKIAFDQTAGHAEAIARAALTTEVAMNPGPGVMLYGGTTEEQG